MIFLSPLSQTFLRALRGLLLSNHTFLSRETISSFINNLSKLASDLPVLIILEILPTSQDPRLLMTDYAFISDEFKPN